MKLSQIQTITEDEHLDYTGINPVIIKTLKQYKPHYQQWALQQIKNGGNENSVIDAINYYNNKIADNRFQQILNKITPAPKNILTLSLDQIKTAQSEYDQKYAAPSKRGLKRELKKNYTTKLVDTPDLTIIKIEKTDDTDGAAKVLSDLARGTKWCVTDTQTGDDYLRGGPLYLIIMNSVESIYNETGDVILRANHPRQPSTRNKYLCSVESEQLMNVEDKSVIISGAVYNKLSQYIPNIGIFIDKESPIYIETVKSIPSSAYWYAIDVIKGRWPEAEPTIMKDPEFAVNYADNVINGRWPEAEPWIMKSPKQSCYYARDVIKGRWPEAEPTIMQDPQWAFYYVCDMIKDRWPEAEPIMVQNSKHDPKRNSDYLLKYAKYMIKGRWPEAEPIIMQLPHSACTYAIDVIKGRWPEAEQIIARNPHAAVRYARDVIKGRWPEAEQTIAQDSHAASVYARDVRLSETESTTQSSLQNISSQI